MVEDTVYLPATIIRPKPSAEQFARDFVNAKVPTTILRLHGKTTVLPSDASSCKAHPPTVVVLSLCKCGISPTGPYTRARYHDEYLQPAAWSEFIKSWKRGDFKRKD
jgi:hypothetical protein